MAAIDTLRKIKKINTTHFSGAPQAYRNIFENHFLRDLNVIDLKNEKIKSSVGQANFGKVWWTVIFNNSFYNEMYGIIDKSKITARIGFYPAYLWNISKTSLYLTIMRESKDLSKKKNYDKAKQIVSENQRLRSLISLKPNYLSSIKGKLAPLEKSGLPKDYEIGTIIAIEYDLSKNITDEQFKTDLINT